MLLSFDLIACLHRQPQTPQSLASALRVSEPEIEAKLAALQAEGAIYTAAAHSGPVPVATTSIPRLDPRAASLYRPLLERTERARPGSGSMSTFERFVVALAEAAPAPVRERALELAKLIPEEPSEVARREHTLALARLALELARGARKRLARRKPRRRFPQHTASRTSASSSHCSLTRSTLEA